MGDLPTCWLVRLYRIPGCTGLMGFVLAENTQLYCRQLTVTDAWIHSQMMND